MQRCLSTILKTNLRKLQIFLLKCVSWGIRLWNRSSAAFHLCDSQENNVFYAWCGTYPIHFCDQEQYFCWLNEWKILSRPFSVDIRDLLFIGSIFKITKSGFKAHIQDFLCIFKAHFTALFGEFWTISSLIFERSKFAKKLSTLQLKAVNGRFSLYIFLKF